MATLTANEIGAMKGLEKLKETGKEGFLFRFEILLLESGLMEPWMCAYNPCLEYRVT